MTYMLLLNCALKLVEEIILCFLPLCIYKTLQCEISNSNTSMSGYRELPITVEVKVHDSNYAMCDP